MHVRRDRPDSNQGNKATFAGEVWFDSITRNEPPSRPKATSVHFTPGARTNWHSHPYYGHTLYITEGVGPIRLRDEAVEEIRPGDHS